MLMGSPRNYKIRFSLTECICQSLASQNEATGASTGFDSFRGQRCQDWETQQHPVSFALWFPSWFVVD